MRLSYILIGFTIMVISASAPCSADQPKVIAIAAGQEYSVALLSDGTACAWGHNQLGQLGDGTTIDRYKYVYVMDFTLDMPEPLSGIRSISAGKWHIVAINDSRKVWTWGGNQSGQLGRPLLYGKDLPAYIPDIDDIRSVSAGDEYTVALKHNGTILAWGANTFGQLGDGTRENNATPVMVKDISFTVEIAAGSHHTLALDKLGRVWAWGENSNGQLGDGTMDDRTIPVGVKNLTGVEAIATGDYHSLALKEDGTVWAWGDNAYGQLGDGTLADRQVPVQVTGLKDVKAIAASGKYSMALKEDGTVWVWGCNDNGQQGNGEIDSHPHNLPSRVNGLEWIKAISAGVTHCMALSDDGIVWTWGDNRYGQLGDGTTTSRYAPLVAGISHSDVTPVPEFTPVPEVVTPTANATAQPAHASSTYALPAGLLVMTVIIFGAVYLLVTRKK